MERIRKIGVSILLTFLALSGIAQNPEYVDPGNVRGDEGTTYLWENPTYYVPVLVVVVLVVALGLFRRSRRNKS